MKQKPAFFFIIALTVFVIDQFTKHLIRSNVGPYDVVRVLPFFNIVYAENVGSAFGMFKSLGNVFFMFVAAAAIVAVAVMIIREKENRLSFSLILGGAMGNLADRILYGHVIDFLDFFVGRWHWPVFNVADSALTVGIMLMAYNLFRSASEE